MNNFTVTGTNPDDPPEYDEFEKKYSRWERPRPEPICPVCNDTGRWEVEPGEFVACYEGCLSDEERRTGRIQVVESEEAVDPWLTYSPGPNDDAGTGHFDGLTPIEEVKQSFQRPQIAGVDW